MSGGSSAAQALRTMHKKREVEWDEYVAAGGPDVLSDVQTPWRTAWSDPWKASESSRIQQAQSSWSEGFSEPAARNT